MPRFRVVFLRFLTRICWPKMHLIDLVIVSPKKPIKSLCLANSNSRFEALFSVSVKIAFCHSKGSARAAGERKWFLRAMRNFFNGKHWQEDRIACLLPREHYHQNTTTILHNMPVVCHLPYHYFFYVCSLLIPKEQGRGPRGPGCGSMKTISLRNWELP